MFIAASLWRKLILTAVAAGAFIALYDTTMLEPRYALAETEDPARPTPGQRLSFTATAYCKGQTTSSGVAAQNGVAAADPDLLPLGSIVELDAAQGRYDGIYTILDTGPAVQGREIDVYMWSCNDALRFGRQPVRLSVVRLGWNPRAVMPSLLSRLFRREEPKQ